MFDDDVDCELCDMWKCFGGGWYCLWLGKVNLFDWLWYWCYGLLDEERYSGV